MAPGGPVQVRIRATRLAEWRRARGLTQRELARRLVVSQNYIPALESGSRDPGADMRGRLMQSLGVGFFELFDIVLVGVAGQGLLLQPAPLAAPSTPAPR